MMEMVAQFAHAMRPVLDLVYPPRCPACGAAIADQRGLCTECWSTLTIPSDHEGDDGAVPIHAATVYDDTSRRLVLAYKHGGRIALARLLARLIAGRLPDPHDHSALPLLVPVPLHRWRLWQRGFNQAALLANELALLGKGKAVVDALNRQKRTPSLGGLGRAARERELAGAIALNPKRTKSLNGRDIILIDDVYTSGATSLACIAALEDASPRSVAIACFARVDDNLAIGGSKNVTPEALRASGAT